ncbi:MAG TPA: FlgD immunoglobulin-like domain containing protein, partial [Bacteroidia bacterium]|nr:FlgD immunoglobulin-like domain containing protein [Bacteroidia bacterium]
KINVDSLLATDPLTAIKQNNVAESLKSYAYPNPFENTVSIGYIIDKPSKVNVEIYTVQGALVRNLPATFETTGTHEIAWDGKNNQGTALTNGVYFYIVKTASGQTTGKLTLLSGKN